MTLAEANALITLETDSASDPEVTSDEINTILGLCQLEDSDGYAPSDASWTGTYDLNLAAAKVFDLKATRCAGRFDFSADGASYKRSQTRDFFAAKAKEYRSRRSNSFAAEVTMGSSDITETDAYTL